MDIYLHLFLCNIKYFGYILICFTFEITELDTTALFLRQGVDNVSYYADLVVFYSLLRGRIGIVSLFHWCIIKTGIVASSALYAVKSHITADGETERLDIVYLRPFVTQIPDFYKSLLHNILCLGSVEGNAKSQTIELVLQRENIVLEINHFLL